MAVRFETENGINTFDTGDNSKIVADLEAQGYVRDSDGVYRIPSSDPVITTPESNSPGDSGPVGGTINFGDLNEGYFQDDFDGFVANLRSEYGDPAVVYVGESALREMWQQGRDQYGLDEATSEDPLNSGEVFAYPDFPRLDNEPDSAYFARVAREQQATLSQEAQRQAREATARANRESSRAIVSRFLDQFGLTGLEGFVNEMIAKNSSAEEILLEVEQHQVYKARFPAMQLRSNAGLAPISAAEYVELERDYGALLQHYSMPSGFYDGADDFTKLIAGNTSPSLLAEVLQKGYNRVANTSPEVRAAFAEYYGVQGDAALAAMYVDPEVGAQVLIKKAEAAVAGGIAQRAGIDINRGLAEEITAFGADVGTLNRGFGQVNQLRPITRETVAEADDITLGDVTRSTFGLDFETGQDIQNRISSRLSAFRGGGGAALTGEGVSGLGTV